MTGALVAATSGAPALPAIVADGCPKRRENTSSRTAGFAAAYERIRASLSSGDGSRAKITS